MRLLIPKNGVSVLHLKSEYIETLSSCPYKIVEGMASNEKKSHERNLLGLKRLKTKLYRSLTAKNQIA